MSFRRHWRVATLEHELDELLACWPGKFDLGVEDDLDEVFKVQKELVVIAEDIVMMGQL